MVLRSIAVVLLFACGCAAPRADAVDPALVPSRAALTVLVFYSASCHCLAAHDARVVALAERYRARGVEFLMVDSETGADEARDEAEARRRGYPFPIVRDLGAKLAEQAGARYATYSVVVDGHGRILYRGGIDSDKNHLHDDAVPYLQNALDDVLAGHAPRLSEAKTLGCSLQTW